MSIEVRLANARDRKALAQFYSREGIRFDELASRTSLMPIGVSKETMFIIATSDDTVCAALKLDIGQDVSVGKIGFIQHFEIEDELESTDLGLRMLQKTEEIAEEKGLRTLDAMVTEKRQDVIKLYTDSKFEEHHKEVYLRRNFRSRIF